MKTTYPFVLVDIETNKYLTKNDSGNKLTGDFIKKTLNKKKRRGKSRELKKRVKCHLNKLFLHVHIFGVAWFIT